MQYQIHREQVYEDEVFDSFEITINGETRYFESPIQPALLTLDDGTVLDVEVIGADFTVSPNDAWVAESDDRGYEHFPSDTYSSPDASPLKVRLANRGVSFTDDRSPYL